MARHVSGAKGNLDQILRSRFDVDTRIRQEEHFPFARDHGVAAGDTAYPNNPQRRADRVGEMLGHTRNQGVGIAHADHH